MTNADTDPRLRWTAVENGHVSTIRLPGGDFEVAFVPNEGDINRDERFDREDDAADYHGHLVTGLSAPGVTNGSWDELDHQLGIDKTTRAWADFLKGLGISAILWFSVAPAPGQADAEAIIAVEQGSVGQVRQGDTPYQDECRRLSEMWR